MLMDDKTYPFIKVTTNEPFPRVILSRKMLKDKAKYFGPYTSAQAVRDTIDLIHKLYHVRSCNRNLPRDTGKERPCLNYHIKQCDAPCQGYISQEEYGKSINEVIRFLNGHYDSILSELEKKMNEASEALEFERAIEYRELLNSVKKVAQKQKITDSSGEDQGCTGSGVRRGRCGRTGILYPGRTSDRQGSLLSADLEGRVKGQYSGQLYQNSIMPVRLTSREN